MWANEQRKADKARERQDEDAKKREENLERAKSITITQDMSLPDPKEVGHTHHTHITPHTTHRLRSVTARKAEVKESKFMAGYTEFVVKAPPLCS